MAENVAFYALKKNNITFSITQLQIYKDEFQQLDSKQINKMFVLRFSWIFSWAEKITNGLVLEQKFENIQVICVFDAIKFFQKESTQNK